MNKPRGEVIGFAFAEMLTDHSGLVFAFDFEFDAFRSAGKLWALLLSTKIRPSEVRTMRAYDMCCRCPLQQQGLQAPIKIDQLRSLVVGQPRGKSRSYRKCGRGHRREVLYLSLWSLDASPAAHRTLVEETEGMGFWIEDIKKDLGITVIMVEHDMALVNQVSDRVMALNYGKVIAMGTPQEVQSHPEVVKAYLGGEVESAA